MVFSLDYEAEWKQNTFGFENNNKISKRITSHQNIQVERNTGFSVEK